MNDIYFIVINFLLAFVHGETLLKSNFYTQILSVDTQCLYIKQLAYGGSFYETNYFSLQIFFSKLKEKKCYKSLVYECRTKNFLFTKYNEKLYNYHCNKKCL